MKELLSTFNDIVKDARATYFSKQPAVGKRNPKVLFDTVKNSPFNCDLPNPIIMESFHPVSLKHLLSTYSNETFNESEEDAQTFF